MSDKSQKLLPESVPPVLQCDTVDQDGWDLSQRRQCRFVVIIFYRGYHSQTCKKYLKSFEELSSQFAKREVEVIALSADDAERATQARKEWKLDSLTIGFGLRESQMNDWGLYVSTAISREEPKVFNEPGLFIVEPTEDKLSYASLTSSPYGRPPAEEILALIGAMIDQNYPARGARYDPELMDTA